MERAWRIDHSCAQTEALWLQFEASYPMAMKVGSGGVCAISGARSGVALFNPPQNYVVLPRSHGWMDSGWKRNHPAICRVPMDKGLTVESEVTGEETRAAFNSKLFRCCLKSTADGN